MINGLALAYIGDAYYELLIRNYLIEKGFTKVNDLHKKAIHFTSGEAQARIVEYLLENELLTDEEIDAYKKGRNSANSYRKNLSLCDYQKATGFEAIIGLLYNKKQMERIDVIMNNVIEFVGKEG